ncbi:cell wall-active antibiotics response protein LiaF [Paenibacillus sp. R14(2021)]|uniref:cell wall-active antibiotics response protein LiaF n=1 Tax=Paenibacillus sp. R14(2021) TaxID=2859228 RepID=UPI001C6148F4|nr:cell wall-active antibiotics response protein LiaF [Paenibacillus sp. R14(2021)]
MNGNFINRFMWGLFIIIVGVGLLLRQSGYVDFDIGAVVSVFWPVILLFLGAQNLLQRMVYGRGSAFGSGVLIIVGFIFLGRNLQLFDWSIGEIVKFAGPLVIIIFGLSMIFKPKSRKKSEHPSDGWQAYNYGAFDKPVPPAPPLHPDPTKPMDEAEGEERDTVEAGPVSGGESDPYGTHISQPNPNGPRQQRGAGHEAPPYNRHNDHYAHRYQQKMERWELRAAKFRERIERQNSRHHQHHRHERVEWWNHDPNVQTRSGFIGDIYLGNDYWELKPMNISHFIGDTVLDLTKAQILPGETVITISSFIGDVKVYLPSDYEFGVHVVSSAFIGDVAVLEQKEGGIFKNMDIETPFFQETDKKIKLIVSTFIGDVRVTKVG